MTHSKKAAAEFAERLHTLGVGAVDARTFHAAGLRVAAQFWARVGRPEPAPSVLSEQRVVAVVARQLRARSQGGIPTTPTVRDLVDEVGWARSRLVDQETYEATTALADRHCGIEPAIVLGCWQRYDQVKTRLGKVDFSDLLEIAADLLKPRSGGRRRRAPALGSPDRGRIPGHRRGPAAPPRSHRR